MASDVHRSGPRWVDTDLATGQVIAVRPMSQATAAAAVHHESAGRPLTFERIITSLRPAVPFSRETHRSAREWNKLGHSLGLLPPCRPMAPSGPVPSRLAV